MFTFLDKVWTLFNWTRRTPARCAEARPSQPAHSAQRGLNEPAQAALWTVISPIPTQRVLVIPLWIHIGGRHLESEDFSVYPSVREPLSSRGRETSSVKIPQRLFRAEKEARLTSTRDRRELRARHYMSLIKSDKIRKNKEYPVYYQYWTVF